ncbi:MAG TPA: Rieske 2Fe-2S domain-containing protein, partial [Dongiaceae bacterium]|nr:Rieske 2Fe-2S domain-containing protein [Dongiaceae bacterium]
AVEDVRPFDHGKLTLAVYRSADDNYWATDGLCTHEAADLTEGFVFGDVIECPRHNGRFSVKTGKALGAPACVDLRTYPVKVEGGRVLVDVGGDGAD